MGFFPSDWDDDEQDGFNGNAEELARKFELDKDAQFSPRELMEIFRYYSLAHLKSAIPEIGFIRMKSVLEVGTAQFPYIPVFAIHLAEVLMGELNYRLARKYINKAKEYNQFEPALHFLEATIYSLEGRTDKATESMAEGLQLAGEDEQVHEDFLELLIHYRQFEMAIPVLERCLDLKADVNYIIEKWLAQTEDLKIINALIPMLERIVNNDPYSEESWYLLGNAFASAELYSQAVDAYDYAVTINDNFLEAWLGYLESTYEIGDYSTFIKYYHEQKNRFHPAAFEELKGLLAWSYYENGNTQEARSIYREILKNNPQDSESWYSLGLTWHYSGDYSAAIPCLKKAWELNPIEADYGIVLAAAYFGNNEEDKWQLLYEVLANDFPEEEEVWLDWGVALHETGDTDKALEITENGLTNCPANAKLLYRMAALCYLIGQKESSAYLLETALQMNAEDHVQMFIFAPELKKSGYLLRIISKHIKPDNPL
jgi:tetratricopeptide (TPR) repeat protein